jgi:hypothetical protein
MKREHLWAHHELDATAAWKLAEGGYANRQSVRQGEEITFHISNSRSYYDIFIFREGAKRELMQTINDVRGVLQPVPSNGYETGFGWGATQTIKIGDRWKSGVYIASFATAMGVREILFIVRQKKPRAPMLLTIATNTYAAYNNVGGHCFYQYTSVERRHVPLISFERPLPPDTMGNFYLWDQFFTSWLDAEGYEVDYCVNADHDAEPDLLAHYKANLRIGHDEYNSRAECEQLQRFVKNGGNLLLFAGNSFYCLVELRDNGRQLFCYKPHYHAFPTKEKPETCFLPYIDNLRQNTIGLNYTSMVNCKTATPGKYLAATSGEFGFFRVTEPGHWIFAGTGLKQGGEFGREDSIVGVETDAGDIEFVDGKPRYTGKDGISPQYRILALADAADAGIIPREWLRSKPVGEADAYGTVAINETEFKGTVFNAATIEWGHGLYRDGGVVAQITRNVLNRLGR